MIKGFIDLHIHTAPDVRPRRFSDVEQAELARACGAAAILLKSHNSCTAQRATLAQASVSDVRVFGAIALNQSIGGLNRTAVAQAIAHGARIVWLPTLDAANHRRREGRSGGIAVIESGRVVPALLEILPLIAESDVALATGHISPEECVLIVAAASEAGIRRIVVTHPEHAIVGMSLELQAELAQRFPVLFERCYAQPDGAGGYRRNLEVNLAAIKTVGASTTLLSSDTGQLENTRWDEAWKDTFVFLRQNGVADHEIRHMACDAPAFVAGLSSCCPALLPRA